MLLVQTVVQVAAAALRQVAQLPLEQQLQQDKDSTVEQLRVAVIPTQAEAAAALELLEALLVL
tara:strand:+ start:287 stop:475 length:189 start_codon:yes stop_codon:yes gene_type:complete